MVSRLTSIEPELRAAAIKDGPREAELLRRMGPPLDLDGSAARAEAAEDQARRERARVAVHSRRQKIAFSIVVVIAIGAVVLQRFVRG